METGTDNKLRAGLDGCFGLRSGSDSAGAKQELRSIFFLEFLQHIYRAGYGHGDFNDCDAAGDHGFDYCVSLDGVAGAQDWDQTNTFKNLRRSLSHSILFHAMQG